jgi:predicted negative regulator of RcsB-dependent stress response
MQKAVLENDAQRIKAASGELLEKYPGTAYAPLAALMAAKVTFAARRCKNRQAAVALGGGTRQGRTAGSGAFASGQRAARRKGLR